MLDHNKINQFLIALEKASDDDELRRIFSTYNADYDLNVPSDPYSEAYRKKQFDLYESLAKKKYTHQNEVTSFDVQAASISPFPYCHGQCETVGNQLMAIGFVIKTLSLPKGAKILGFGPGWGNTTIALAKMGFDVTEHFIADVRENIAGAYADLNYLKDKLEFCKNDLGQYLFLKATNASRASEKVPSWLYRSLPAERLA